jgi:hypothetical protein
VNPGELRVPTVALAAEIYAADGRVFRGRIFVPAAAPRHEGAERAVEWINEGGPFFPFLPDEASTAVILNKHEVLAVTVAAEADIGDVTDETLPDVRRVVVECGDRRFEGNVVVDMPEHHRRVLDFLNRAEPFLVLRDADRHHLVQKARIARVLEKLTP